MPCNGGNYFGHTEYVTDPELVKRVDVLTRRLCHACQLLEESGASLPKELDEWWYEHKLEDEARIAEAKKRATEQSAADRRAEYLESVRERVMNQLTDDEIDALGL